MGEELGEINMTLPYGNPVIQHLPIQSNVYARTLARMDVGHTIAQSIYGINVFLTTQSLGQLTGLASGRKKKNAGPSLRSAAAL